MQTASYNQYSNMKFSAHNRGQLLIEIVIVMALAVVVMPALLNSFVATREGRSQQQQRVTATAAMQEMKEAVRSVRESGWANIAPTGTFKPVLSGNTWTLSSGTATVSGFSKSVVISDVNRDSATGAIVSSGGFVDPSTKKATMNISWKTPYASSIQSVLYFTRYLDNLSYTHSTMAEFNLGVLTQTQTTNVSGGEVMLSTNTKAKWCSPAFSSATIDLPDGPPVAVDATASASVATPNDVIAAIAPYATTSGKLAYVQVSANVDPPVATMKGTFTLDPARYSTTSYIPTGINLTNSFATNDVKYYKSATNKKYALLATNLPDHELVVVQINDGTTDAWQDPTNHIYKYWTFFNTKQYNGDNRSTPNQDQAPFGYGAVSVATLGTNAYLISGGYMYVVDLSNIDSKTPATGLDMVGCRIQLDGYDCSPGTGTDKKYNAGETGVSWSSTATPAHNDCHDGGNVELYADNDIYPIQVGANTYVYVAVGAGTNPEFEIVNATTVPTNATTPKISNSSCGTSASGAAGWKVTSSLDFNSVANTEEAANSVFAKSDGTRAYISSNGGIDANSDGTPDSKQFYVIDTSNKSTPKFLTGTSNGGPTSGYYYGGTVVNGGITYHEEDLYPKRSLTVLNGQRAVLVGKDGTANANNAEEYQVLNIQSESTPAYCGGIDFNQGFNDLKSVTEADGDNYVYMVADTSVNELKIIQGGPDGTYLDTGTYESSIFDAQYSTAFNKYTMSTTVPPSSSLQIQFAGADAVSNSCTGATYSYTGPDGTAGTYYTANTGSIALSSAGAYKNPARCFRYKMFMSTTDYNSTPILKDMTINYSP